MTLGELRDNLIKLADLEEDLLNHVCNEPRTEKYGSWDDIKVPHNKWKQKSKVIEKKIKKLRDLVI
jgi:hypothetical protein